MTTSKKRKIPMRVRRKIFYAVFTLLFVTIIICICAGANKADVKTVNADGGIEETETVSRYRCITIADWELDEMASVIFLEAGNQSFEGQQAVAEVILNRVLYDGFPNSIHEVLHDGEKKGVLQFTTIKALDKARPTEEQYKAINKALYGKNVIPLDVVFFSQGGENANVWGKIDDHIFCYAYKW